MSEEIPEEEIPKPKPQRWRTIQFFLDDNPPAVAEVQATEAIEPRFGMSALRFRCTCARWSEDEGCAHVAAIISRIHFNGGRYAAILRSTADDALIEKALGGDDEAHRWLLVHESMIEVL